MGTQASSTSGARASRPRRHTRHYLINARFQLKYTALLVGVVVSVMAALGAVIWQLGNTAAQHAQYAAAQAEVALRESHTSSRLVRMNALASAGDNPDLVKILEDELADTDRQAEKNLADVQARRGAVESNRRQLLWVLLGAGSAIVLLLTVMGIFITHRIVGPVFKLKRLLRQAGTGRLVVKERLRRGDELGDLFDTFLQMTLSLKALQIDRLVTLDAALRELDEAGTAPAVAARLRELRAQMQLALGEIDPASTRSPMSAR
jgi:nitrogen fixation/metabolism regulation signal transduction histidine kinase